MYHITVYDNEGNKLLDEPLQAQTDHEAKAKGRQLLLDKEYQAYPFRIFHTSGRLVEFLSHKGKKATEKQA
jgi:hypothetical protein